MLFPSLMKNPFFQISTTTLEKMLYIELKLNQSLFSSLTK